MKKQPENIIDFPQKLPEKTLEKPLYDPLAPTIFHEPWWLDICTGGHYKYAEVHEHGEVAGRLPYFPRKKFGLTYSILPPMTHFLGPAVTPGDGSFGTRFLRKNQIIRDLIQQLPKAELYQYKCHRDITDVIAFQQEKFFNHVQFTHEIVPQSEEELWKGLRLEKRRKIKQAQKLHTVVDITDPQEFWHFYDDNYRKRGIPNICEEKLCCNLVEASIARGQGRILATRDQKNEITAMVYCIWDATTSFYFMSTRAAHAHNGAISLLAWEGMKDASARGLIFDFDGVNNSQGVLFFTDFGGILSPRYIVTRKTLIGNIALSIKDRNRENKYFF